MNDRFRRTQKTYRKAGMLAGTAFAGGGSILRFCLESCLAGHDNEAVATGASHARNDISSVQGIACQLGDKVCIDPVEGPVGCVSE